MTEDGRSWGQIGAQYEALIAGIITDTGVPREVAEAIVARTTHWISGETPSTLWRPCPTCGSPMVELQ